MKQFFIYKHKMEDIKTKEGRSDKELGIVLLVLVVLTILAIIYG